MGNTTTGAFEQAELTLLETGLQIIDFKSTEDQIVGKVVVEGPHGSTTFDFRCGALAAKEFLPAERVTAAVEALKPAVRANWEKVAKLSIRGVQPRIAIFPEICQPNDLYLEVILGDKLVVLGYEPTELNERETILALHLERDHFDDPAVFNQLRLGIDVQALAELAAPPAEDVEAEFFFQVKRITNLDALLALSRAIEALPDLPEEETFKLGAAFFVAKQMARIFVGEVDVTDKSGRPIGLVIKYFDEPVRATALKFALLDELETETGQTPRRAVLLRLQLLATSIEIAGDASGYYQYASYLKKDEVPDWLWGKMWEDLEIPRDHEPDWPDEGDWPDEEQEPDEEEVP